MKVLVTGGAGFIGSHVVDMYIEQGFDVVVIDDLSTGRETNLNPNAKFYKLDIRNPDVRKVFEDERFDIVNHHAAQMDVRRSVVEPNFDADVNILGSINLIECAVQYKVNRFIYISTGGAVYGEPEYLPCDEAHPINPICQYGVSKHTVEHYLYLYKINYGLNYTVLRYPNVYGPRQDPRGEAGVVAIFLGRMLSNREVTINGDGEQRRDYVYVGDCAWANLLAVTNENGSGIYNLGSKRGTSVNEIFAALQAVTGYDQKPIFGPPKLGETRHIYLDPTKAQSELGWYPKTDLMDGLRQTAEYVGVNEAKT
jgi:UDP-glucose 4-epimerase